jgi:hypothetical protein
MEADMGKPYPMDLRTRVVDFVEEGNTHRATAAHFRVSIKFVNDMVKLKRETGSLEPKRQGRSGHGKLAGSHDWVRGGFVRLIGADCYDPSTRFSGGQTCGIVGPKAKRVRPRVAI